MSDVRIRNEGSIVLLEPLTDAAEWWVKTHIGEDNGYQPFFPTVVAEPRYVGAIVNGMQLDGLEVEHA